MDNSLSKLVKIMIPEQIARAVIFYFGQVFVFCWSINKIVLERFLLIISKKYTLTWSTNLLSRNHSTFCFWLGCTLLIPCSLSDWGLICQFAVQSLLVINYFLVQKVELKICYYYCLLKFCLGLTRSLWHNI